MHEADLLFGLTDALPRTGRHAGFVKVPFSADNSAYGFIPVPIAILGGGDGPTVLLIAGTYGDELDSQMALSRVAKALDSDAMTGRVIILPSANTPAARAGTRNSPLDGRNLNRSFPGDIFGTPTSIIADYIERQLMPVSDIVLDLHSDGRSIHYVPSVTLIHHADPDIRARRLAAALAFGAPNLIMFQSFEERSTSGAARRAGKVRIATEIGGAEPVTLTFAGVMRLLAWAGIIRPVEPPPAMPACFVVQQDQDFTYALHDGAFEPVCRVSDVVSARDVVGYVHDLMHPFAEPVAVRSTTAGTVLCTRSPGLCALGDCLMHLGAPADGHLMAECKAAADLRWLPTQTEARHRRGKSRSVGRARS